MFIAGLLLFSAASLAGGFATSQAWLLAARAAQGAGAATIAAAALALIATTFPEGPPRNRAMGVYAAMSVAGGAVGLIAGGLLTTYASWRWVLFVNVPIGLTAALAAPRVLHESGRERGRFDLPGAVTATGGLAAPVYGLSSAATSPDGTSHWGDAKVLASLTGAVVLLAAFAVIQVRSGHALLPLRLLADRDRTGANLIMLCVGAAIFGMFFFLGCLARLLRAFGEPPAAAVPGLVEHLTARELEILALLAAGTPNPRIAEQLVVSLDTVKKHVSHLLGKLGAVNRTEAVTRARELGLIP